MSNLVFHCFVVLLIQHQGVEQTLQDAIAYESLTPFVLGGMPGMEGLGDADDEGDSDAEELPDLE